MLVSMPFGKKQLQFEIPDKNLLGIITPEQQQPLADKQKAILAAIRKPIGCLRLSELAKPGQKVVIIPTDITRSLHENIILPLLLDELNAAGVPDEDITMVIATGTHRPNNTAECREMYGEQVVNRVKIINHFAFEPETLTCFGDTPTQGIPAEINNVVAAADLRISTAAIEPHLFAGYSGGVKSLAVGVAGVRTIAATHNVDVLGHPRSRLGVIEGNIFRNFLEEATAMIGLDFIVNLVMNEAKEILKVVAGEPVKAHAAGVEFARRVYERKVDQQADIVIAAPGYPKDRDLYQATRAVNTSIFGPCPLVKPGGVLIIPAPCQDGIGHESYHAWMKTVKTPDEALQKARQEGFAPGEHKVFVLARILKQAELMIVGSAIPPSTLQDLLLTPVATMEEALARAFAKLGSEAKVWVLPYGVITIPVVKKAGEEGRAMADTIPFVKIVIIDPLDNVATAVEDIKAGEEIWLGFPEKAMPIVVIEAIPFGHKVALVSISKESEVVKYGEPIGTALSDIQSGQHVHIHNVISNRGRGDLLGKAGKGL